MKKYRAYKFVAENLLKKIDFKPVNNEQITLSVLTELLYQGKIQAIKS